MPHKFPLKWCAFHFGDYHEYVNCEPAKAGKVFQDLLISGLTDVEPAEDINKLAIARSWQLVEDLKRKKAEWADKRKKENKELKKELKAEQASIGLFGKKEPAKPTETERPPRHEMLKFALSKGITEADFMRWYEQCEYRDWFDTENRPIRVWQNYLLKWPELKSQPTEEL